LNLQSPYNIIEVENGYRFETDFGAVYELTFLLYPIVNTSKDYLIYMFNIEPIKKGKPCKDDRIRLTIECVLSMFFRENVNAIIVVMDSMDNKQNARQRLFDSWYKQSNYSHVEKYEAACETDDLQLLTILLIEKSNPFKSQILEDYFDLVKINFYS
jgi:hypothetical protein